MADGYLNFNTKISTKGFENGVNLIGKGLNGLKSSLKSLSTLALSAFGIAGLTAFSKKLVETTASVKAQTSQMEQTFGALQGSAEKLIKGVADSSGILETRLESTASQIYSFAKASGMDSSTALTMMSDALQVTADSAAYYDKSLEATGETLRSFLKGNYANDAALGISCTETTRNIAANKLYGKSFQELSEAQKQLALLQMVKDANRLSGAEGQAAREADGWENVLGNLKEAWRQLLAVVGQPVLSGAIEVVKSMTSALTELTEKAKLAVGAVNEVFGIKDNQTAQTATNIADSVASENALTEATEETTEAQKELNGSLAGFDKLNTVKSKENDEKPKTAEKTAAVAVIPKMDEAEAVKEVNPLIEKLSKLAEPLKIAWDMNSPKLVSEAETAAEKLKSLLKSIGESLAEVWTNGSGERLTADLIIGFTDVLGIIGDISGALENAWNDGGRGTALVQSYADKWSAVLELLHSIGNTFRTAWNDGTGEAICGNILEIMTNINNVQANLAEQFRAAWDSRGVEVWSGILTLANTVLSVVNRITAATADWAGKLDFEPILTSVSGLLKSLNALVEVVGGVLADVYEDVLLPLAAWTIEDLAPAAVDVLSGALDVLTAVIKALRPMGEWLWNNLLQPIAEWTGGVIVAVLEDVADTLKKLGNWIKKHQTAFQDFVTVITSIGAAFAIASVIAKVTAAFTALGGVVGILTTVVTALGTAWAFVTSAAFLVPLAIGAIIAIGILLIKHWDEVKEAALGLWESIQETLYAFYDKVLEIFNAVIDFVKQIGAEAVEFLLSVWTGIKAIFEPAADWFGDKFEKAWKNITKIFSVLGSWFKARWSDVKLALSAVPDWFREKFRSAWDSITGIFSRIGAWFSDRYEDIKAVFEKIGEWFGGKFQGARDTVNGIFSGIGGWFGDRWSDIKGAFGSVGDWFRERFQSAYDNVTRIWDNIKGYFSGLWTNIADGAHEGLNWIVDKINWFIERVESGINGIARGLESLLSIHIPDNVPGIGGVDFGVDFGYISLPRIPRLAAGTVVPANFGEFAAILGDNKREPEIVSPVSAMKQAFREAITEMDGNAPKQIVVNTYLYPNSSAFHREVINATNAENRRKGV